MWDVFQLSRDERLWAGEVEGLTVQLHLCSALVMSSLVAQIPQSFNK